MSRFKAQNGVQEQKGTSRRRFLAESGKALVAGSLLGSSTASTLLSACGSAPAAPGSPVEVSYTFIQFGKLRDAPLVSDAMNRTLQFKRLGLKVRLNPLDFASYDQKLQLAYASGAEYDAVFTAPWVNAYVQNATKGNFLPLDDLLPRYAPGLYKSMPEQFWEATKVKGNIYGIPNQNYFAYVMGIYINKPLADKYASYIPAKMTSFADIGPFLAQVKAHEPDVTPVYLPNGGAFGRLFIGPEVGFDIVQSAGGVAAIRYDDPQRKVFLVQETPEYRAAVELRWKWGQVGYYKHDAVEATVGDAQVKAGEYAMLVGTQAKPNDIPGTESKYSLQFIVRTVGTPFLTTDAIQQNMNAIVRSCQHPDKTLQFLNLVNTDATIFNLLAYGIEGKHYIFKDRAEGLIDFAPGVTAANSGYNPSSDWMFGNEQLGYYTDPNTLGIYANIQQANNTAARSTAFGFLFDPIPIKTELARLQAINSAMDTAFTNGQIHPDSLPGYIDKLKQAGAEAIVAEVQQQLDAWAKMQ